MHLKPIKKCTCLPLKGFEWWLSEDINKLYNLLKQLMLKLRTILQVLILDRHFYFLLHSKSCFSFNTNQWKITLFLDVWRIPIKIICKFSPINPISLRVIAMFATLPFYLYLMHFLCSEFEQLKGNRVKVK